MAQRQYLTAKFRPGDKRSYTYHNDGDPVAPGDEIKLPSARGADGWVRGTVHGLISEAEAKAQPFETKAILGKVPPPEPEHPLLAMADDDSRDDDIVGRD